MNNKKNTFLVGSLIVLLVLIVAAFGYMNKNQETVMELKFPTAQEYEASEVVGPVDEFDYEKQPSLGSEDALVKVVEFGDYKCSHCFTWKEEVFPKLYAEYIETGKVQFYFLNKQFLAVDSVLAGVVAEAVYHQSEEAFWEFHEALYSTKEMIGREVWGTGEKLLAIAHESITVENFDFEQLKKEMAEFTYLHEVKRDSEIGNHFGVTGTPTVFVNGEKFEVKQNYYEELSAMIDAELETNEEIKE